MASSAMATWSVGDWSNVDAITSPGAERRMSVTSSGRSPTSTTIRWHSGLFLPIACAIACSTEVLPALGGATISARWPLPTGMTRSITRVVSEPGPVSRRSRSVGCTGTRSAKALRDNARAASTPLTVSTRASWADLRRFSSERGRAAPVTWSPRRRPCFLAIWVDTTASAGPGR